MDASGLARYNFKILINVATSYSRQEEMRIPGTGG
jgi:hypothetical protein